MSLLSSVLGLDQSASQKTAIKQRKKVGDTASKLYDTQAQIYADQQKTEEQANPILAKQFFDLANMNTQAGRDAQVSDFARNELGHAEDQAALAHVAAPNSPDIATGMALDAKNQANTRISEFGANVNSAQGKLQGILALMQAKGLIAPDGTALAQLGGAVMNNPNADQRPNGILPTLAGIAGQYFGGQPSKAAPSPGGGGSIYGDSPSPLNYGGSLFQPVQPMNYAPSTPFGINTPTPVTYAPPVPFNINTPTQVRY